MKIKGFDKDLKCRGFQFEIGKTYDTGADENKLELCTDTVFHYCDSLQNVHKYYSANPEDNNRFCEIEVLGKEVSDGQKCGSNKIKIVREIIGEELDILRGIYNGNTGLFNTGDYNTGNCNTGDYNTGYYNTGDRNTGYYNTGDRNTGDFNTGYYNTGDYNTGNYNTGDRNTGNCNTGDRNTGYYNTGDRNTGDYNTGNYNTGDYNTGNYNTGDRNTGNCNTGNCNTGNRNTGAFNSCNFSSGFFCTEEPKVRVFDIEIDMTVSEFYNSKHWDLIKRYPLRLTEWIKYTEEEKKTDEEKRLIGGYLKKYSFKEACAAWWSCYSAEEQKEFLEIPNFDKKKFKTITGIEVK